MTISKCFVYELKMQPECGEKKRILNTSFFIKIAVYYWWTIIFH